MYAIVWDYEVKPEAVERFIAAYGPGGAWAELFGQAEGFIGVELWRAAAGRDRFMTLDRWRSRDHFLAFMHSYGPAYAAMDKRYEGLTFSETRVGEIGE